MLGNATQKSLTGSGNTHATYPKFIFHIKLQKRERQREREGRIAAKWLKQSFPIFNGNVVHILFFI